MLMFLGIIWLVWIFFVLWWTISPKHFVFNPNLSRSHVLLSGVIAWFVLTGILIFLTPNPPINTPQQQPSIMDLIGFILAIIVCILLIIFSLKAKKRHDPNQLQAFIERQNQRQQSIQVPPDPIIQTPPVTPVPPVLPTATTIDFEFGADPVAYINYTNANGERTNRPIIVREIFFENHTWQVRAVDTNKHQIRQFRIDRITRLEHNGYIFTNFDHIKQALEELRKFM